MNSNQILIITIIILIISGISTFISYTNHFSGNIIYDNVTFWQLVITDINHEEGVYRGWPGEVVGARISPARMCYDDEGSPTEMYIYYYGGEYPYGSDSNMDYDNPENNKNIHFGTTRVTGDQPQLQVYFDKFGTYNIKGWPVWVTFSCGQANFNIKQGDALIIRYNTNQEVWVKLPEITGTGDKTIFLSWPGESYDNPQLTGEPLAPKYVQVQDLIFYRKVIVLMILEQKLMYVKVIL